MRLAAGRAERRCPVCAWRPGKAEPRPGSAAGCGARASVPRGREVRVVLGRWGRRLLALSACLRTALHAVFLKNLFKKNKTNTKRSCKDAREQGFSFQAAHAQLDFLSRGIFV